MKFRLPWVRAREKDKALEEKAAFVDATTEEVLAQTPQVNALVAWLENRKLVNGFGADFEFTLANPRR